MINIPISINNTTIADVEIIRSNFSTYDETMVSYSYTVTSGHTVEPMTGSVKHNPADGALKLVYAVLGDFLKET